MDYRKTRRLSSLRDSEVMQRESIHMLGNTKEIMQVAGIWWWCNGWGIWQDSINGPEKILSRFHSFTFGSTTDRILVWLLLWSSIIVTPFLCLVPLDHCSPFPGRCRSLSDWSRSLHRPWLGWNCICSALGNNEKIHLIATGLKYLVSFHFAMSSPTPERN